jgi:DNA-binding NtrC family response regulator
MNRRELAAPARVLVVANSHITLTLLPEHLTAKGQTVAVSQQPAEVLTQVGEWLWDAVVIDLTPITLSIELVRQIAERQPSLATIVLSSDQRPDIIKAGQDAGVYSWLVAPCPVELVLAAIDRAYERQLLQRQQNTATTAQRGLSSNMLHTVNNQLAGIIGLVQLHISDETLDPEMRADLEMVLSSARTVGDLLKSLRND